MYDPNIVPQQYDARFLQDELQRISDAIQRDTLELTDGVRIPGQLVGKATIYIDQADGDMKIIFSDGTIKTITIDT